MKRALLFASGTINREVVTAFRRDSDITIAVDSGFRTCRSLDLKIDFGIGDFDSLSVEELHELRTLCPTHRYPHDKDQTDLELALRWAHANQINALIIFGALHSRFDHSLSAVFDAARLPMIITFVENSFICSLLNESRKRLDVRGAPDSWISVFAFSPETVLRSEGLEWPLAWPKASGASPGMAWRRSQSNRCLQQGLIELADGLAFVIEPFKGEFVGEGRH